MTRRDLVVLAVSATGPDPQVHFGSRDRCSEYRDEAVLTLSASDLAAADL